MAKTRKNMFGWLTKKKTTYHTRLVPVGMSAHSKPSAHRRSYKTAEPVEGKAHTRAMKQAEANLEDAHRHIGILLTEGSPQQKKEAREIISQYEEELRAVKAHRNPPKRNPGLTGKFERCVAAVKARSGAYDPKAVCASEERRLYGQKALTEASMAGKKRAARKRAGKNPDSYLAQAFEVEPGMVVTEPDGFMWTVTSRTFDNGKYRFVLTPVFPSMTARGPVKKALKRTAFLRVVKNPKVKIGSRTVNVSRRGAKAIRRLVEHDKLKPRKRNAKATKPGLDPILVASSLGGPAGPLVARYLTNPKRGKRNPENDAEKMYELFHGKPADNVVDYETPEHTHFVLWCVGDLACLRVTTIYGEKKELGVAPIPPGDKYPDPSALPITQRIVVAANEDGTQLFFVSGDQSLDLKSLGMTKADERDNMLIGVLTAIVYQTRKGFDEFELTNYTHKLGEETGMQPVLIYHPRSETMEVSGGQYRLKAPGIIN